MLVAPWLAACTPDRREPLPSPPVDPPTAETGVPTTPPTTPTVPTTTDSAPTPPACDDHLACTEDALDAEGRCVATPLYDCGWPAAAPSGALDRTSTAPGLDQDLSGIAWNPAARELWLARNAGPSEVWRLVPDGAGGWALDSDAYGLPSIWSDLGDLEGIAVPDPSQPRAVVVLDEGTDRLLRYDLTTSGFAGLLGAWDLSPYLPDAPPLGPEAVTFVPDAALAAWGFVDDAGAPALSARGMGALAFVGHQNGGQIYVFDLDPAGDALALVATLDTARDETSGLEFDASSGRLYVWHGGAWNDLEVARLSSTAGPTRRALDVEAVFDQPDDGNLEGMALLGVEDCGPLGRALLLADDDGGARSLLEYPDWPLGCP